MAYQLLFLDEVTDRFCESGIKALKSALALDPRLPRPRDRPTVTPPTGATQARVWALSAQLGPANPAGLPDGGFFGGGASSLGPLSAPGAPPAVALPSQAAGGLGTPEGNSAQVATLLSQMSELLAGRAA